MEYRHFFNTGLNSNNVLNNIDKTSTMNSNFNPNFNANDVIKGFGSFTNNTKNFIANKCLENICSIGSIGNMSNITTSPRLWATMLGLSIPALCFAGYKLWKWIDDISKPSKSDLYEYRYLDDLDKMLESKLDDMKNPDMADVDTIKVGNYIFPLDLFRSFKKNYRKKILRQSDKLPLLKCVPIPAEEFNWSGSFTEDVLPNEKIITMRYEPDTESFWWYCDSSTIPYKYLETVARKYVCEHNRLDVFIDIRDELKKGAEDLKKRESGVDGSGDGEKGENEKKIYAKFRRYNKKNARTDASVGGKRMIIKARANRYSYKGKMEEYNLLTCKNVNSMNLYQNIDTNQDQSASNGDSNSPSKSPSQSHSSSEHDHDHDAVKVENISWNDWKNELCNEWKPW